MNVALLRINWASRVTASEETQTAESTVTENSISDLKLKTESVKLFTGVGGFILALLSDMKSLCCVKLLGEPEHSLGLLWIQNQVFFYGIPRLRRCFGVVLFGSFVGFVWLFCCGVFFLIRMF